MSAQMIWIVDDSKLVFLWQGMFLYLIHLLHLFYIKLFFQSKTTFTNDEHTILRRLSFIFALFDLFEKHVN